MRIETTESSVKLVEHFSSEGLWRVRWDFRPKLDSDGNPTGVNWYEEEAYGFIPTIEDIQQTITEWYNKQTNERILHGFEWNGRRVLLSDENKFNYKAIIDEAARRETAIAIWDKEHPNLAGVTHTFVEGEDGEMMPVPTGRPTSLLPITLKLGEKNVPENFYVFTTLAEIQEFFAAGVQYLIDAYGYGWMQIATFDYTPYVEALANLNNE